MKTILRTLALVAMTALFLGAFSGCNTAKIPGVTFGSWTHDGNYGVFTTHVEAHGAVKDADGKLHIASYTGAVKVAGGYGPSDTITDLVIDTKNPVAPVKVLPSGSDAPIPPSADAK